MALKKYCSCGALIDSNSKCSCNKERHKEYNKRRNKKINSFYSSNPWIRLRDTVRVKYKGLCLMCLINNNEKSLRVIHHIITLEDDEGMKLVEDNLVPLCQEHHGYVHEKYKIDKKKMQKELYEIKDKFNSLFGQGGV